ncbi:MAG: PAS domain-containing protein [Bacteroidales bacterium]|jgi:two-component system CheB/CheR fusion protein
MTKTIAQLTTENKELHSRLSETEEMLDAIRNGEMDAIVVSGTKGEQVYSISSPETPYRTFVEEMNEGALTLTKDGVIIYCNKKFAKLVKEPIEHVMGSSFKYLLAPADQPKFDRLLARLAKKKNDVLILSLTDSLYLKLSFLLLPSYLKGDHCILIATDISEIKLGEKKLLELQELLVKKLDVIQRLRLQLIDKKIENEVEIREIKKTNKNLVKEIAKYKLIETELKYKLRQKKAAT